MNHNFSNLNPPKISSEGSSLNLLLQNIFEDSAIMPCSFFAHDGSMDSPLRKIYNELSDLIQIPNNNKSSVNFEESCFSNSEYPCMHGEEAKKIKMPKVNNSNKRLWREDEDRFIHFYLQINL